MFSYLYIIYFFIITIHASSYFSKCPEEDSLRECLDQYHIKGLINFRDNVMAYNNDINFEFNKRIIHFPVAFVHPIDEIDVQSAVKCAIKLNFPITARSGGHSPEGYGLGDKDCYLVVDLRTLNKTTVSITSQTAIVGTGNTLGSLYKELQQYIFAFPAGDSPSVGVGGHMPGGGIGFLNRKFGISSDNILDAQIVLANGTVVYNSKKYPELLWAIRGAGNAGYGIITSLTIKIYPIQKIISSVQLEYDFDHIPSIFSAINQLGSNLHQNLTFTIDFVASQTVVRGIYLGSASELQSCIQEFIKLSRPKRVSYIENDFYNLIINNQEKNDNSKRNKTSEVFKLKSFFINSSGLSYEGIKYWMRFAKSFKCPITTSIVLLGGGRVNEIRRNETAFVHRGFLYLLELVVTLQSEICIQELEIFSKNFQQNYTNFESYQNYVDRNLDNWQCRYYGKNFEKLVEIKQKYDPYNLFHWNQSIPTNTNISCNDIDTTG